MKEYTVQERAAIVRKAMPAAKLGLKQQRQIEEALYTLSEAGGMRLDVELALEMWRVVEMVKAGAFSDEMRL